MDLCWSPTDDYIASCSIDNTVAIISLTKNCVEHVLKDHISCVKGVAWDPTGKFLASQSDKDLILWNVNNQFQAVKRVTTFSEALCDFRRLSWSPDGGMLAVPCGNNEAGVVLDRNEDWKEKLFKGHTELVTNAVPFFC